MVLCAVTVAGLSFLTLSVLFFVWDLTMRSRDPTNPNPHVRWHRLATQRMPLIDGLVKESTGGGPTDWEGTRRFFYPSTASDPIMNKETDPCTSFYEHTCGNWQQPFNRFIVTTMSENAHDISRLHSFLETGRVSKFSSSKPVNENSAEYNRHNNMHKLFASCVDHYRALLLPREARVHNLATAVRFHAEWRRLVTSAPHWRAVIDFVARVETTIDRATSKQDIGDTLFEMAAMGIGVELHSFEHRNETSGLNTLVIRPGRPAHTDIATFIASTALHLGIDSQKGMARLVAQLCDAYELRHFLHSLDKTDYVDGAAGSYTLATDHVVFPESSVQVRLAAHSIHVASRQHMVNLDRALAQMPVDTWKSYLVVCLYEHVLRAVPDVVTELMASAEPRGLVIDHRSTTDSIFVQSARLVQAVTEQLAQDASPLTEMCARTVRHTFPLSYCSAFVAMDAESAERQRQAAHIATEIRVTYRDMIVLGGTRKSLLDDQGENVDLWCSADKRTRDRLLKHFDSLRISVGECSLGRTTADTYGDNGHRLLLGAERNMNVTHDDFGRNTVNAITDRTYMHFRPLWLDYGGASMLNGRAVATDIAYEETTSANAWYQPESHTVTIPPGILRTPMFSTLYDTTSQFALLGFQIAHELTHATEAVVYEPKRILNSRKGWQSSCEFRQFEEALAVYSSPPRKAGRGDSEYERHWYSIQTFYENRADWIGLNVAYEAWRRSMQKEGITPDSASAEQRNEFSRRFKQFFVAYAQLWCSGSAHDQLQDLISGDADVHSAPFYRVDSALNMLKPDTRTRFKKEFCAR
jgi:hypothetical protein